MLYSVVRLDRYQHLPVQTEFQMNCCVILLFMARTQRESDVSKHSVCRCRDVFGVKQKAL